MNVEAQKMINWMDETFTTYASDSEKGKQLQINFLGLFRVMQKGNVVLTTAMLHAALEAYNGI